MGGDATRRDVVFMPHHSAAATGGWDLACKQAGVVYLDPRGNCETLIHAIAGARLVIADAMHGAIVADVLRVPWVPVVTSTEINTFKWLDWTLSMRVPYRPFELPILTPLQVARRAYKTLVAQRDYLPAASAATALDAHARGEARRPPAWLSAWRRSVLPVERRTEPPIRHESFLTEPWKRQLDKAIGVLQRLTGVPGVLSDDRVLEARHTSYEERLEALRRLLDDRR
jgi:succinoglycan biosynthesis protein ExoV